MIGIQPEIKSCCGRNREINTGLFIELKKTIIDMKDYRLR